MTLIVLTMFELFVSFKLSTKAISHFYSKLVQFYLDNIWKTSNKLSNFKTNFHVMSN